MILASRPGLCPLLQFLVTGSPWEAKWLAGVFFGASKMLYLLCLLPGQLWCQSSPLGRMTYLTKLRTLLAAGCAGPRTGCRRSWVFPSRSSMAVASSSTALVSCPTAGPSPLWVSQDPSWEQVGYRKTGWAVSCEGTQGWATHLLAWGPHSRLGSRHT